MPIILNESTLEILGIVAVVIMVVSYAVEDFSPFFVLLFAAGCALAAFYALLIGAIPFLIAETVWAVIALRRWHRRREAAKKP